MFGYSREELLARRVHDITHPEDLPRALEIARQLTLTGEIRSAIEQRCVRKDGTVVWIKLTAGISRVESGESLWGVAVVEDIAAPTPADVQGTARFLYAGISVNTGSLDATWDGQSLSLSPKEALLPCYLIRHQGEVVTRERLLRNLWGSTVDATSRTLDAHVCRLRRKVPPLAAPLMTIGRVGYTLRADPAGSQA